MKPDAEERAPRGVAGVTWSMLLLWCAAFFPVPKVQAQNVMLDINRVHMLLTRFGNLSPRFSTWYNTPEYSGPLEVGTIWYNGFADSLGPSGIVYDHGLLITGKIDGHVGMVPMMWASPYSPGPIIDGRPVLVATHEDSMRYRVYRVTAGDDPALHPDLAAWPAELGAPVDERGAPKISGDQTLWSVYNALGPGPSTWVWDYDLGPKVAMPLEVHQTVFGHFGTYSDTSIWANSVFLEYAIYNRGTQALDSMYLSFWSDVDFLDIGHTIPAVDTLRQAGYCWYSGDSSMLAVAYSLLFGPHVPAPGRTAAAFGKTLAGARNLPLSSFYGIFGRSRPDDIISSPQSVSSMWNIARGLAPSGERFIDPTTGQGTCFPWSGDPRSHTGMLFPTRFTRSGGGFMLTTGPVSLAPGDSQWIMLALVPEKQHDGLDAITWMRRDIAHLQALPYDSLVAHKPRRDVPTPPPPFVTTPPAFSLFPAYPNPFNGTTTFRFTLSARTHMRIEIFDILGRKVEEVANGEFERGYRQVAWTTALASGLYIARIQARSLEGTGGEISSTQRVLLLR